MGFWDKVQKDLKKGLKESYTYAKGKAEVGYTYAKEKAGELTEEGKKRLKLLDLKLKVRMEMTHLGGKVYDMSGTSKNPLNDSKVKTSVSRIKRLEAQIAKIEGKVKAAIKPKADKAKAKAKRA